MLFGLSQALLVSIPFFYYLLLFLGTLAIYWIDHIQDSKNALLVEPGARHAIFKERRIWFMLGVILLFILNGYLALTYLPFKEILYGLILFVALLGYLRFHRQLKRILLYEKEILISLLYTLSIAFAPWFLLRFEDVFGVMIFGFLFLSIFCTALQNLFSVARIEQGRDGAIGIRNITHLYGEAKIHRIQVYLLLLQLVSLAFIYLLKAIAWPVTADIIGGDYGRPYFSFEVNLFLVGLIQFLLPYIYKNPKDEWYRIVGDGAFGLGVGSWSLVFSLWELGFGF